MSADLRRGITEEHTADYFSNSNAAGTQSREELAQESLEMLIDWLKSGGNVGVHGDYLSFRKSPFLIAG